VEPHRHLQKISSLSGGRNPVVPALAIAILALAANVLADSPDADFQPGDKISAAKLNARFKNIAGLNPPGTILAFAGSQCPAGYLPADGTKRPKTAYPALYEVLGTSWGPEDSNNFQMPDLRGSFLRGSGSQTHENISYDGPGVGQKQPDSLQQHTHTEVAVDETSYYGGPNMDPGPFPVRYPVYLRSNPATSNASGRTSGETRPFNHGVIFCIKD
jgi:microcystin-dependent protein